MSPSSALRAALYTALRDHAPLTAALGGPRVYDMPPAAPEFPYVTLGEAQVLDWSSGTEAGEEHRLTLHIWSRQPGHGEAHDLAALVQEALHDVPLPVAGARLINLRASGAEFRREAGGRTTRAVLRFRAVLETD